MGANNNLICQYIGDREWDESAVLGNGERERGIGGVENESVGLGDWRTRTWDWGSGEHERGIGGVENESVGLLGVENESEGWEWRTRARGGSGERERGMGVENDSVVLGEWRTRAWGEAATFRFRI